MFKNPSLAGSYRLIAEQGRDAFYKGPIAREIVEFSDKVGGLFALKDFAEHTSTWVDPVKTSYRGVEVWEIPPPGQGIAVLQMLNILEGYDLKKLGPTSADFWHLMVESKKLAYADRARYYADPAFVSVPTAELISKPYAEKRRELIRTDQALKQIDPGDTKLGKSDTVYLCVVDKDRNCVSLIQSNYYGFGSGLVPARPGSPCRTGAPCWPWTRSTLTGWSRANGRSTRSFPRWPPGTASRGWSSASWAATCSRRARPRCWST